jgi:hypothetical protein
MSALPESGLKAFTGPKHTHRHNAYRGRQRGQVQFETQMADVQSARR